MWEVWEWNGRYIKGNRIKRVKTKETAVKHAKKAIKHKKMVKGKKRGEFFLEDEDGRSIGMLLEKKSETKNKE
tara:strand:- start:681 stop:899 length:219 start_codon:yes stop_codon:yes gene_type:complete